MSGTDRPVQSSQAYETTKLLQSRQESYLTVFPRQSIPEYTSRWRKVVSWIGDTGVYVSFEWPREPWRAWAKEEISGDALVLPLLIVTFSCALADAVTLHMYGTFATSMTGNTVLLALRTFNQTGKSPLFAGLSLLGFVVSGLVSGQLGGVYGHRRRWWLCLNTGLQIILLLACALLVSPWSHGRWKPDGSLGWIYIFLLSIQGGVQVTQAANAGARELPTAMMTTPYAAFISDPALFTSGKTNDVRSRNRRFLYIVIFWFGAFAGAALTRWTNMCVATLCVAGCKVVVLGYIVLVKQAEVVDESPFQEDTVEEPFTAGENGGIRTRTSRTESPMRRESDSTPPTLDRREEVGPIRHRSSRDERSVAM